MNIMAAMRLAEMRRVKLERQRRNLATPPPTHPTPTSAPKVDNVKGSNQPDVVASELQKEEVKITGLGDSIKDPKTISERTDQGEKGKKKREESGPSSKPINLEPPTKQQRTDDVGGSSVAEVVLGAKSVHPSVWDDHFDLVEDKDAAFLSDQSLVDVVGRQITHIGFEIASAARYMEATLSAFEKAEEDHQAAHQEIKVLKEQNKKLEEESAKLADDLKSAREALSTEKIFKGLAEKEKKALQVKYDEARLQIKYVKYSYLEAKAEIEAYENIVQQLKILNPNLVVLGSDPYAYVINGVIMEDSAQGPIPFAPSTEVIGDSDQALVLGLGKKVEDLKVENPVPSGSQQQPKEDPK
ncbi:hypothetical protein SESBI_22589 [Sesbania bispinosa]|nr:hypothetical protein SESBI_22589 [Sesbania bispinosa]